MTLLNSIALALGKIQAPETSFGCDEVSRAAETLFSCDQGLRLACQCNRFGIDELVSTNPTLYLTRTVKQIFLL